MNTDFDVCIVGSGAGTRPVALTLAEEGYSVVVLEKGPWFEEKEDKLSKNLSTVIIKLNIFF